MSSTHCNQAAANGPTLFGDFPSEIYEKMCEHVHGFFIINHINLMTQSKDKFNLLTPRVVKELDLRNKSNAITFRSRCSTLQYVIKGGIFYDDNKDLQLHLIEDTTSRFMFISDGTRRQIRKVVCEGQQLDLSKFIILIIGSTEGPFLHHATGFLNCINCANPDSSLMRNFLEICGVEISDSMPSASTSTSVVDNAGCSIISTDGVFTNPSTLDNFADPSTLDDFADPSTLDGFTDPSAFDAITDRSTLGAIAAKSTLGTITDRSTLGAIVDTSTLDAIVTTSTLDAIVATSTLDAIVATSTDDVIADTFTLDDFPDASVLTHADSLSASIHADSLSASIHADSLSASSHVNSSSASTHFPDPSTPGKVDMATSTKSTDHSEAGLVPLAIQEVIKPSDHIVFDNTGHTTEDTARLVPHADRGVSHHKTMGHTGVVLPTTQDNTGSALNVTQDDSGRRSAPSTIRKASGHTAPVVVPSTPQDTAGVAPTVLRDDGHILTATGYSAEPLKQVTCEGVALIADDCSTNSNNSVLTHTTMKGCRQDSISMTDTDLRDSLRRLFEVAKGNGGSSLEDLRAYAVKLFGPGKARSKRSRSNSVRTSRKKLRNGSAIVEISISKRLLLSAPSSHRVLPIKVGKVGSVFIGIKSLVVSDDVYVLKTEAPMSSLVDDSFYVTVTDTENVVMDFNLKKFLQSTTLKIVDSEMDIPKCTFFFEGVQEFLLKGFLCLSKMTGTHRLKKTKTYVPFEHLGGQISTSNLVTRSEVMRRLQLNESGKRKLSGWMLDGVNSSNIVLRQVDALVPTKQHGMSSVGRALGVHYYGEYVYNGKSTLPLSRFLPVEMTTVTFVDHQSCQMQQSAILTVKPAIIGSKKKGCK